MNEKTGEKKFKGPIFIFEHEAYLDWDMLCELLNLHSTSLFRIIKKLDNVPVVKYKNRCYYALEWAVVFWKIVADAKKKGKKFSTF